MCVMDCEPDQVLRTTTTIPSPLGQHQVASQTNTDRSSPKLFFYLDLWCFCTPLSGILF